MVMELKAIKLELMELGEEDDSGRRKPMGTGKFIEEELDFVVMSLGFKVDPDYVDMLSMDKGSNGEIKTENFYTNKDNIFAAGDVARDGALVSKAGAAGRDAAEAIIKHLTKY